MFEAQSSNAHRQLWGLFTYARRGKAKSQAKTAGIYLAAGPNPVMGICMSCFKGSGADITTPQGVDATVKRQQMAEAAERRLKEQEHRGIKDPEKVKRQQQKRDELEQIAATGPGEANLRVITLQDCADT